MLTTNYAIELLWRTNVLAVWTFLFCSSGWVASYLVPGHMEEERATTRLLGILSLSAIAILFFNPISWWNI